MRHVTGGLKNLCDAFKLPKQLRKTDFEIKGITKHNYMER
jgi:hypothetical protein